jgi:hypothetical protein
MTKPEKKKEILMSNSNCGINLHSFTISFPRKLVCRIIGAFVVAWVMMAMPGMAYISITAPDDNSVYCVGDTIEAGGISVDTDCSTETASVGNATVGYVDVDLDSNYKSIEDVPLDEAGWETVSSENECDESDSTDIAVAEFVSLDVDSSATDVGDDNYAILKQAGAVLVTANVIPGFPESGTDYVGNKIVWSGTGYQDTVSPRIKAVPTTDELEATVAASLCNGIGAVKVWVIWATVTPVFSDSGFISSDATFANWCPGNTLGGWNNLNASPSDYRVAFKLELVGKILPTGAGAIVSSDWKFKQNGFIRDWNGSTSYTTPDLSGSDSWGSFAEDDSPDGSDQIVLLDAPSRSDPTGVSFYKTQFNFQTHVEWNGHRASDDSLWYEHVKAHYSSGSYHLDTDTANTGNPTFDTSY